MRLVLLFVFALIVLGFAANANERQDAAQAFVGTLMKPTPHANPIPPAIPPNSAPPPKPTPAKTALILPPVEYDHYYEGDLTIKIVNTLEDLYAACGTQTQYMLACSMHTATACLIIMVRDEIMRDKKWTTGILMRHEIGHCNGWPGDHPGQRRIALPTTHWAPVHERPIAKNIIVTPKSWQLTP